MNKKNRKKKISKYVVIKGKKVPKDVLFLFCTVIVILFIVIIGASIIDNNSSYKYICPDGYELEKNECIREFSSIEAQSTFNCDLGYTLSFDKCVKTDTNYNYSQNVQCPIGYLKDNSNRCYKVLTSMPITEYFCPQGYIKNGSTCKYTITTNAVLSPKCPIGSSYSSYYGTCVSTFSAINNNTCFPNDFIAVRNNQGNIIRCVKNPSYEYVCTSGRLSGSKCLEELSINASSTKRCPDSTYVMNSTFTSCIKTVYTIPTISIGCMDSGYTYMNGTCTKTIEKPANIIYYCNSEYTLKNNKCVSYERIKATKKKIDNKD